MSDTEDSEAGNSSSEQVFIVMQLQKMPEVLLKSQVPHLKSKKDVAIKEILAAYEKNLGKLITSQQLLKKINNMKSRLKKKADRNRTGNKKIVLKDWEKVLFELMDGEDNTVINEIPGKLLHSAQLDVI